MAISEKLSTSLSESQFLRMRPANFMGSEFPQNIWCKEAVDNCTDIITEGRSTQAKFMIMDDGRTIVQMDNGIGISTRQCLDANGIKSTYLYNSIHKLYSGSNYGDENTTVQAGQDTAGTNGIGFKLVTCISKFSITGISKNPVKYAAKTVYIPGRPRAILKKASKEDLAKDEFARTVTIKDGSNTNIDKQYAANIDEFFKTYPTVDNVPDGYAITCLYGYVFSEGELITLEDIDGNPVKQDPATPQFIQMVVPLVYKNNGYAEGFITVSKLDDTIVPDLPDTNWLQPYITEKVRSIKPVSDDVFVTFSYPVFGENNTVTERKTINYARPLDSDKFKKEYGKKIESGEIETIISWEEQVEAIMARPEAKDNMFRTQYGYFDIVFAKDQSLLNEVNCVVQGARVLNPKTVNISVPYADQKINIPLPCVWKLSIPSKRISVSYSDQTKVKYQSTAKTNPKMSLYSIPTAAMKIPEVKQHVESEAAVKFLKKANKPFQSDFYWPASGGKTAREYFKEPFLKNKEYAYAALMRAMEDEDSMSYAKEKGYELDSITEKNANSKENIDIITELVMVSSGVKPEKFDSEFKILIIVEGHSASSGIRTMRDSKVVGVLALRGKILNVWQKDLSSAMKSEIVKELINVLQDDSYDMIISCTDADADGSSITTLLLGVFVRFRKDIVKEGRLFNNLAPLYTFKDKSRKLVGWSNDKSECPKGAKIVANKGLGSYDIDEIKRLILNPSAGAMWEQIVYDKDSKKSLTMALESGGKELVYMQKGDEILPFCG